MVYRPFKSSTHSAKKSVAVLAMEERNFVSFNETRNQTDAIKVDHLLYARTELASALILAILSPITVVANLLLITAIIKDPLKYFKRPTNHFVLGLSMADLLCGFFVEPFFAFYFFSSYFSLNGANMQRISGALFTVGSIISTASLNSSFVMVLLLSVAQLVAIDWPYKYRTFLRKDTAILCVVMTWVYFTLFSLLPVLGIDRNVFFKVNLFLHATLISLVLAVVQILVYRSYQKARSFGVKNKRLSTQFPEVHVSSDHSKNGKIRLAARRKGRSKLFDRNFTIVTFYLAAILLFAAFPHIAVFYVFVFKEPANSEEEQRLNILLRITDLLLFTKAGTDAFIFAWRLPTYRKSLYVILSRKVIERETRV